MVTLWVFQQGILLTLTVLTSAKEADNSVWFMPCCQLILSCAFLPSFLDAGWIGRAKNTTKPTRKRYTFAPIYRSLKTSFKAIFCADPESILFDIFHPGAKIHFSDFIKAKREKKGKIYFPSVFSTGKQIVFFCSVHYEIWAAFDTLQLMHTKPFVFWYGNQICGVFISSEPISNKSGACQLSFPLFYTGQIGIPAVSNVRITKLEFSFPPLGELVINTICEQTPSEPQASEYLVFTKINLGVFEDDLGLLEQEKLYCDRSTKMAHFLLQ